MESAHSRQNAALALALLVSAASLGMAARLYLPGITGQLLFVVTRLWLLGLPLIWFLRVDYPSGGTASHRGKVALSFPTQQDWLAGVGLGLLLFSVIMVVYWFAGKHWINPEVVQTKAQQIGLANPISYLIGAFYFTFINSLVEEYIWRWFVYQKCEVLVFGHRAVYLSALCFTLHHVIALLGYTENGFVVVLGSIGVFAAGAIWSGCYLRYRSLWACYFSHLLADLAIALVGWHLLFGHG